ncbi:MAG: GldG family protein [Firmicutes bacterium]|nr:GldG family protein [Bacillota bacterium]
MDKKKFRLGTYTAATTVAVIAIAVIFNMCINALPSKIKAIDLNSNEIYSIGEQTRTVVKTLEEDVHIYWLVQEGYEDVYIENMLANYEDLSKNVVVEKIDPVVYPTFAYQYTSDGIYNNSLIVTNSDETKTRYLSYYDIYLYSYDENYNEITEYNGEGVLTSAIKIVTSDIQTKLYYVTGHGEKDIPSELQKKISLENMEVESVNLLKEGAVPADCEALIVYSPLSDFSAQDIEILSEYLENGGKMLLFTDCTEDELTNLYGLMSGYGVDGVNGVVMEQDSDFCLYNYANYLLPGMYSHDITTPLINSNYFVLMPMAHGIEINNDFDDESITATTLLQTSEDAFVKKAGMNSTTAEKETGDVETEDGFAVAVAITDVQDTEEAKIVWMSSSYITDAQMDELASGANTDFVINSLGWLCEIEDSVTIRAKSISYDYLTMTASQSNKLSVLIIFVIPAAFIAAGIYVWVRRRKM